MCVVCSVCVVCEICSVGGDGGGGGGSGDGGGGGGVCLCLVFGQPRAPWHTHMFAERERVSELRVGDAEDCGAAEAVA